MEPEAESHAKSGGAAGTPGPRPGPRPVFLLAGGRRTGSTLVQRLLISSGEVLVWGEHEGVLVPHLHDIVAAMERWIGASYATRHLQAFRQRRHDAWIPNVNPPLACFQAGCRAFLEEALGRPARALHFPRWGFKEVRYGADAALFLQALHVDARFILLVRHPADCLRSLKATAWGEKVVLAEGPLPFLLEWARLSEELLNVRAKLTHAELVRYEEIVEAPEPLLARISAVADITPGAMKVSEVLGHRIAGPQRAEPVSFSDADRAALENPTVQRVARLLGY